MGNRPAEEEEFSDHPIDQLYGTDAAILGASGSTSSTMFDSKLKELGNLAGGGVAHTLPLTYAFFNVPVAGTLRDSKLQLTLGLSVMDFDEEVVKAHARYLILDLLAPAPYSKVIEFSLPYKNAEFILGRAVENKPIELTMEQQVRRENGNMITYKHEYEHRGHATEAFEDGHTLQTQTLANYDLTFKACSSPCH
jgi:hypothetical protein